MTDAGGNVACDFTVVQVISRDAPDKVPPSIQAAYSPSLHLKAGQPATFKVRTFRTTHGEERWDFGDGSPAVTVKSDANKDMHAATGYAETIHKYAKPGHYLVSVEHASASGVKAVTRLQVRVGME